MLACELISKVLSSTCSESWRRKLNVRGRKQEEESDVIQTDS